jgi:hypothetical protein
MPGTVKSTMAEERHAKSTVPLESRDTLALALKLKLPEMVVWAETKAAASNTHRAAASENLAIMTINERVSRIYK